MLCSLFIVACRFKNTLSLGLLFGGGAPGCKMPLNMTLYRSIFVSGISTSRNPPPLLGVGAGGKGGAETGMGGAEAGMGAEMSDFLMPSRRDLVEDLRGTGSSFGVFGGFDSLGVFGSTGVLEEGISKAGSVLARTTLGVIFFAFLVAVVLLLPTSSGCRMLDAVLGRASLIGVDTRSGVDPCLSLASLFFPEKNNLHLLGFFAGAGSVGSSSHGGLTSMPRSCGCQFPPVDGGCDGGAKLGLPMAMPMGAVATESGVCVRTAMVGSGDLERGLPCGDGSWPRMGMW